MSMWPTRARCLHSRLTWTPLVTASSTSTLLLPIKATGKSSSLSMTRMLLVSFCNIHLTCAIEILGLGVKIFYVVTWNMDFNLLSVVFIGHVSSYVQCSPPAHTPATCLCVSSTMWRMCWKCTAWAQGRSWGPFLLTSALWWVSQDGRGTLRSSTILPPSSPQVWDFITFVAVRNNFSFKEFGHFSAAKCPEH